MLLARRSHDGAVPVALPLSLLRTSLMFHQRTWSLVSCCHLAGVLMAHRSPIACLLQWTGKSFAPHIILSSTRQILRPDNLNTVSSSAVVNMLSSRPLWRVISQVFFRVARTISNQLSSLLCKLSLKVCRKTDTLPLASLCVVDRVSFLTTHR